MPKPSVQTVAKRVIVSGAVQGVGYRYALAELARNHNIQGWCRNLPDGRVEAWMTGGAPDIDVVMTWMRQGTPQAQVDDLWVEDQAVLEPMLQESIAPFEIRK